MTSQASHAALPATSPSPPASRNTQTHFTKGGKSQQRTHSSPQARQCNAKQAPASSCSQGTQHSTARTPSPNTQCPTRCPLFPGKPGGPILPGTPGSPFMGKKRDRERVCYMAVAYCNITQQTSNKRSQLFRNQAGCLVTESDGVFLYRAHHRNSNQVTLH